VEEKYILSFGHKNYLLASRSPQTLDRYWRSVYRGAVSGSTP
jgi:hypothetical protein